MSTDLVKNMQPLTWIEGIWEGHGKTTFPTHEDFDYQDSMRFKLDKASFAAEPLIHFEEMAWVLEEEERTFKHWETGYFKPEPDGRIQFYACHNTGRIEVTYGTFKKVDLINKSFEIEFISNQVRNDEGIKEMLESRRVITFRDQKICYTLLMSTTEINEMTCHLNAELVRTDH